MSSSANLRDKARQTREFSESLEAKAREQVGEHYYRIWDTAVLSLISREIVLVLNHLDACRELHRQLRRHLLRQECYVDTELMGIALRTPTYSPYQFPEREKVQRRLLTIAAERRRLAASERDKIQGLQDRLLSLLNKHTQLKPPENGHTQTRPKT